MARGKPHKVVFLYTELADYIRSCFDALAESGAEVHVIAYPVNPEAPFEFDKQNSEVHYYRREDFDDKKLIEFTQQIDPKVVFCSGWIDSGYLTVCRAVTKHRKTILISDNAMTGSPRSILSALRARLFFKPAFDATFVPGRPQDKYARIMGFDERDIKRGFYTIDPKRFAPLSKANTDDSHPFPKRFVFAGRYVDFKGVHELWQAFARLGETDWELHCIGTGPLFDSRPSLPGLYHHGFVQPSEMDTFVARGGVFVLPSHKEPWGMVVHEFASAGYPLICSDKVGAATAFLIPGKNGYEVRARSINSLADAMKKITNNRDEELRGMARQSLLLAKQFSTEKWVDIVKAWII